MIHRHRHSSRLRSRRRSLLAILLALVAPLSIPGCNARFIPFRGGSDAPPAPQAPVLTESQAKMREASEQAALDPNEPYWPYRIARLHLAADSVAQAQASLEMALARDPLHVASLSLLSKIYFESGRHDQAVKRIEDARARPGAFPEGTPPVLIAGLALHYDALGRPELARAVLTEMPKSAPKEASTAMVYLTLQSDHPDAAGDLAAAALRENGKSAANHNNYGITRLRAGDPTAARKAFIEAIELDPKLASAYYNLAILEKYYVFDDQAAAKWLKAYWDRASDDPDSLRKAFAKDGAKDLAGTEDPR